MFSYAPTERDRSGELLAAGMIGAADTQANAMAGLGQNIGGALQSIGGAIGGVMEKNAMGDTAYEALGAIGQMYPGMKSAFTALGKMDPRTRRLASMSILDNLGAISQLGIAGMNNQTRQNQQALTAALPDLRNRAQTDATIAGGGGTVPLDDPSGSAPAAQPGTGALQAASAWYNQSAVPTSMSRGSMQPFWKR